ncbi:NAD-dependent epimerase/dehydratase family protein [Paractinoplanes lichenicola]|uniref:NAD-dependent epimerase/dehydratase family protein n=1 Tax=Paractinoplanes lichenicola TaxID=2802976 RepID=A0ABS1W5D9_9ACTN|nr:NAD-dependent epimerase/dehydratase family protein [Actinoplanes lichenicola]MBL7261912.1 NAD-dependent epimerase/dehydratase family protein [Actinoplanes lichenicola]
MRVLLLGGTGFVGRAVTDLLDEPTLFNRGTDDNLFPGVERRRGDRETGDYASLATGEWDAVVDTTAYYPWQVRQAMDALGDRVGRYLFVSSHAVFAGAGPDLRPADYDAAPPLTNDNYGPAKVACEQEVVARFGARATIVRPVKVAGPHDNQNGLTDWVRAAVRGGRFELPGDPAQPVQLVDSRDLARLVLSLLTDDRGGAHTAAGPSTDLAGLMALCAAAAGTEVEIVPVAEESYFPLVKPRELWDTQNRSPAEGQTVTLLETTVRDVLSWIAGSSTGLSKSHGS